MEKTIFEKIIDGEIPSYKVYEDEHVYSFLDVFPITKGHTLVIPKKHSRNIFDCDPETAANIGRVLPKIANAVKELKSGKAEVVATGDELKAKGAATNIEGEL